MIKKLTCKTDLKENIIKKNVFNREVLLCKKFSKKSDGCCWGKCKDCGVVPLLYKLHKGKIVENENDVKNLKKKFLGI